MKFLVQEHIKIINLACASPVFIILQYFYRQYIFFCNKIVYVTLPYQKNQPMKSYAESKRKFLAEINSSMSQNLPRSVRLISERAFLDQMSLHQKFKNLQDPLGFLHNQKIQKLVDKTEETTSMMKKQMQETSQLSKNMYKKIISREGNQFNFQNIKKEVEIMERLEISEKEIMKSQRNLKRKQAGDRYQILEETMKIQSGQTKVKASKGQVCYRHQREQLMQAERQISDVQLNFGHIKLIDTPQFQKQCNNVEFYNFLKPHNKSINLNLTQQFDINNNNQIQKHISKIDFQLVENCCEYNSSSQLIFYDFQKNLNFWKLSNKPINPNPAQENKKLKDETILSKFNQFNKKQISVNNICDFAMGKSTIDTLRQYLSLKKQHKMKQKNQKGDQNLEEMYDELKKEYDYAHELKMKLKSQRIPIKYVDSDCQTIRILEQKQFDEYFSEDIHQIFEKLSKINKVRQRTLASTTTKNKMVIVKNACYEARDCLFKLLTMILKGQKFYPRQKKNQQYYAPFFTYNQLFDVQNRQEVEKKLLQLVYTKIEQFKCEEVDGISKAKLIQVYVQERQKNNRILEIIADN